MTKSIEIINEIIDIIFSQLLSLVSGRLSVLEEIVRGVVRRLVLVVEMAGHQNNSITLLFLKYK